MSEHDQARRLRAAVKEDSCGGECNARMTELLTLILERQDTILERVDKLDSVLEGHMCREEAAINDWMNSLPKKPDGKPDVEGHRDYHQELIEEARARKTMWRELRTEILKKGTWGIVLVLTALVMYWWNHEVKK